MEKRKFLVKFGEAKYMDLLYNQGCVHMGSIMKYRNADESDGIGDKLEGSISYSVFDAANIDLDIDLPDGRKLQLKNGYSNIQDIINITGFENLKLHKVIYNGYIPGYIYCMSDIEISIDDCLLTFDSKCITNNYYDTAILFTNREIVERIEKNARENGFSEIKSDIVKYNKEYLKYQFKSPFIKRTKYKYQSEYRIFIECQSQNSIDEISEDYIDFEIGSTKDIAIKIDLKNTIDNGDGTISFFISKEVMSSITAISC